MSKIIKATHKLINGDKKALALVDTIMNDLSKNDDDFRREKPKFGKINNEQRKTMSEKENIVKLTCKELSITQKELAEQMGVAENTVSQWSRGIVDTPKWALKMFELLKIERNYKAIKHFVSDLD